MLFQNEVFIGMLCDFLYFQISSFLWVQWRGCVGFTFDGKDLFDVQKD